MSKWDKTIDGIRLNLTCGACPEQYDAFLGERLVGYLRLRHGGFTVECPTCDGELVYASEPDGDGSFTPEERSTELTKAVHAIKDWLRKEADRG